MNINDDINGYLINVIKKPTNIENVAVISANVITTRSWRAGYKLISKELGPNKLPASGNSPPTKDKPPSQQNSAQEEPPAKISDDAQAILKDMKSGMWKMI